MMVFIIMRIDFDEEKNTVVLKEWCLVKAKSDIGVNDFESLDRVDCIFQQLKLGWTVFIFDTFNSKQNFQQKQTKPKDQESHYAKSPESQSH